jgi:hypothetical protein
MGTAVINCQPEIAEVHGLIEAAVRRDDAGGPGSAFDPGLGW